MTFADDFVRLKLDNGLLSYTCIHLGLKWPPPTTFEFLGFPMRRVSMSKITDEQKRAMTSICRGAEYEVDEDSRTTVPCRFCGHSFDRERLGKYGCPNCEGKGMKS